MKPGARIASGQSRRYINTARLTDILPDDLFSAFAAAVKGDFAHAQRTRAIEKNDQVFQFFHHRLFTTATGDWT